MLPFPENMPQDIVFCIGTGIGIILGIVAESILHANRNRSRGSASGGSGEGVELYVGNLSYDTTDRDLEKAFGKFGNVVSSRIIINRSNGRSKGFGFVEMIDDSAADKAIKAMHGNQLDGRKLVVNEAKSRSR